MNSPLGPGGRPFRGWRVVPVLLSLGGFGVNLLVLLSDRAPGLLGRISARIDAGVSRAAGATGLEAPGGDVRVPRSDFDLHVALWAVVAVLVGLASWSWLSLLVANTLVFSASLALELSQPFFTASRTVQREDLLGNAVGVLLGTGAAVGFALLWRIENRGPARR